MKLQSKSLTWYYYTVICTEMEKVWNMKMGQTMLFSVNFIKLSQKLLLLLIKCNKMMMIKRSYLLRNIPGVHCILYIHNKKHTAAVKFNDEKKLDQWRILLRQVAAYGLCQ